MGQQLLVDLQWLIIGHKIGLFRKTSHQTNVNFLQVISDVYMKQFLETNFICTSLALIVNPMALAVGLAYLVAYTSAVQRSGLPPSTSWTSVGNRLMNTFLLVTLINRPRLAVSNCEAASRKVVAGNKWSDLEVLLTDSNVDTGPAVFKMADMISGTSKSMFCRQGKQNQNSCVVIQDHQKTNNNSDTNIHTSH